MYPASPFPRFLFFAVTTFKTLAYYANKQNKKGGFPLCVTMFLVAVFAGSFSSSSLFCVAVVVGAAVGLTTVAAVGTTVAVARLQKKGREDSLAPFFMQFSLLRSLALKPVQSDPDKMSFYIRIESRKAFE